MLINKRKPTRNFLLIIVCFYFKMKYYIECEIKYFKIILVDLLILQEFLIKSILPN
jgi:hypothetical protein